MTEDAELKYLKIIRAWLVHWMNNEPGYSSRALMIDANMRYDLARRLAEDEEKSPGRTVSDK